MTFLRNLISRPAATHPSVNPSADIAMLPTHTPAPNQEVTPVPDPASVLPDGPLPQNVNLSCLYITIIVSMLFFSAAIVAWAFYTHLI
ncbi:hypothetical protein B0O99DRAFT_681695 [Bisporella sp. PMI_857]|nr:hypothetical protein B0O99DRAFT_681695 [Bisporella sp. PMI_857]